jgi:AbrB family looped-hinge helix DNA binding protein
MAHKTSSVPQQHEVLVGDRGRVVLPAEVREELGLNAGDKLVLTVEVEGTICLRSLRERLRRSRGLFRSIHPERILSRELLRERRREAKREEGH